MTNSHVLMPFFPSLWIIKRLYQAPSSKRNQQKIAWAGYSCSARMRRLSKVAVDAGHADDDLTAQAESRSVRRP
jgi:hypothetical protein